jgi:hypothetical protein
MPTPQYLAALPPNQLRKEEDALNCQKMSAASHNNRHNSGNGGCTMLLRRLSCTMFMITCVTVSILFGAPAWATVETITLTSGDPAVSTLDANGLERDTANLMQIPQTCDGSSYGLPEYAYVIPPWAGAWGAPAGTSRWINSQPTPYSYGYGWGCAPVKYQTTFVLPDNFQNAAMSMQIMVDDWVEIYLNGMVIFRTFVDNGTPTSPWPTGPLFAAYCSGQQTPFFSCLQTLSTEFTGNGALTNLNFVNGLNILEFRSYDPDGGGGLDYLASISYEQVTTIEDLTKLIRELINEINSLPAGAFQNANMRNALVNKLNAIVKQAQGGEFRQALDKMNDDVTAKMDGCAAGAPDNNDWIISCEAQATLAPLVGDIVQLLVFFSTR